MVLYRGIWCCIGVYGDVKGCMVMYGVYGVVYGYMVLYMGIWCCIGVYRGIWCCMGYIGVYGVV